MAKVQERLKARALRRRGKSVKEIAKLLSEAPSSVSNWVRDIVITDAQREQLRRRRIKGGYVGRMRGAEVNRLLKLTRIDNAAQVARSSITSLSKTDLFFLGLGLYWGEGVKAASSAPAVVNSDARILQVMVRWFRECLAIEPERFRPYIFISEDHRDRERQLLAYWSKALDIPSKQFGSVTFLKKNKKIYENRDVYYGVLALRILKGTDMKYRILAYIDRCAELGITSRRSSRVRTRDS